MNVSLHLHRAERPAVTCADLSTGTACLQINATRGELSVFGTRRQLEVLHAALTKALFCQEPINEADIHGQG